MKSGTRDGFAASSLSGLKKRKAPIRERTQGMTEQGNKPTSAAIRYRIARCIAHASAVLSTTLCAAIAVCYTIRRDAWAAVTVFPVWVWVLAGIVLLEAGKRQVHRRWRLTLWFAWCVILLVFADHPTSLIQFLSPGNHRRQVAHESDRMVRIVSLNSAGSVQSLAEVALVEPDIVLIQESPGREPLIALARELFGDQGQVLPGVDASIVVNGAITPVPVPNDVVGNAVHTRVELADGRELEIVSLRLEPPLVRIDLWCPECWREQTANRQRRRKQLHTILSGTVGSTSNAPMIVGGDFNAPPRDAVFRLLAPYFHDAFVEAGRGWGNTIINSAPFLRIDQVWLSPQIRAVDVYSLKTKSSDHRMVVCDAILTGKPPGGT